MGFLRWVGTVGYEVLSVEWPKKYHRIGLATTTHLFVELNIVFHGR